MSNISSEQKLRLIHRIREENQSNQLKMRTRESILYGKYIQQPTLPLKSAQRQGDFMEQTEEIVPVSTLKLRFLFAAGLFAAYLMLDMGGGSIFGKNAGDLYLLMEEDYQSNIFDFISNITYTLDNKAESN